MTPQMEMDQHFNIRTYIEGIDVAGIQHWAWTNGNACGYTNGTIFLFYS